MAGASASQAVRTHCLHGHEWNEENTYRNPDGDRICRACRKERRAVTVKAEAKPRTLHVEKIAPSSAPAYWTDTAACTDTDPEVFFPVNENTATTREAREICRGCPVREECLDEAMRIPKDAHGIWAGLTRDERRNLRRRRVNL